MMSFHHISSMQTPPGNPKFIHLDPKYCCKVCGRVVRDAMQTVCGHRICETCVPQAFEGKEEPIICPAQDEDCEPLFKNQIIPDRSGRREVRKIPVYCTFKQHGCDRQMSWSKLEAHEKDCTSRTQECRNKQYGCREMVPLKDLDVHSNNQCEYRLEPCTYCQVPVPRILHKDHEQNECPSVPVNCLYQCGTKAMARSEMARHVEVCPSKPSECKFKGVGCEFVGTGQQVAEHMLNDVNQHLEQVTVFTGNMEVQTLQLRRQLQEVSAERDSYKHQLQQMQMDLQAQKTNTDIIKGSIKEMKIKMVSLAERLINLERHSENAAKRDVVERHDKDLKSLQTAVTQLRTSQDEHSRPGTAAGSARANTELSRKVEHHDNLFARLDLQLVELDLRFQIMETASYDGKLLWKLREYTRRKREAVNGQTLSLYSQPFYTHRHGYKMCARVYLNGDGMGKGSHMSLFFVIMRGDYDNLLVWPFQHKVTMLLLDQETGQTHLSDTFKPDPTSSSFRKPASEMNIASGCPLFVAHSVLESPTSKYIKDETLFIKFEVDLENCYAP